jgi:PE family
MDMSYVIADPALMTSAASDLARIGSNVSAAHLVAAARTVGVIPAAADEVSAGIAHLFSQHVQDYQALAAQASAFHGQFVQHLTASAASYANTEALSVDSLQLFPDSIYSQIEPLIFGFLGLPVTLTFLGFLVLFIIGALVVSLAWRYGGIWLL